MKIGDKFITNEGYEITIVEFRNSRSVDVRFECGFIATNRTADHVRNGRISYPYKRTKFGIGYIGSGEFKSKDGNKNTREYNVWSNMIERCYSNKNKNYSKTTVCDEWHNFQNFAQWYNDNSKVGFDLDKDLYQILLDDKIYSPQTCVFIPCELNSSLAGIVKDSIGVTKYGKMYRTTDGSYHSTYADAVRHYVEYRIEKAAKISLSLIEDADIVDGNVLINIGIKTLGGIINGL